MRQWQECKQKASGALLLFRLGDFYEAFFEDAAVLSKAVGVTLTKRGDIPMSGVPAISLENYLEKLVEGRFLVAIAEQMEPSGGEKKLVERQITRFVSPATFSGGDKERFFAVLYCLSATYAIAFIDVHLGRIFTSPALSLEDACTEIRKFEPLEILVDERIVQQDFPVFTALLSEMPLRTVVKPPEFFSLKHAALLQEPLPSSGALAVALDTLMHYLRDFLLLDLGNLSMESIPNDKSRMKIDFMTEKHLNLLGLDAKEKQSSLFAALHFCKTPMGTRLLKSWMASPLLDIEAIEERFDAIEAIEPFGKDVFTALSQSSDLARMAVRIGKQSIAPKELLRLHADLMQLGFVERLLKALPLPYFTRLPNPIRRLMELQQHIHTALDLDAGALFKQGYDAKLDRLQDFIHRSGDFLTSYQNQLRESLGIRTLRVSYNNAFGYFIEVSRAQADKMPADFERQQTLVNAERYISTKLKEFEVQALHAADEFEAYQKMLYGTFLHSLLPFSRSLEEYADLIAHIDAICSLCHAKRRYNLHRPRLSDDLTFTYENGRHLLVEKEIGRDAFIPNDLRMAESDATFFLITGPNMGGKSTFVRQTALMAVMAQIGSFVPAENMHLGIVDRVFSRIGASDNLYRGQSTFMVEMVETAAIVKGATERSLVVLDEIGRGTSTYDGIAIAWAVSEELARKRVRTLFATHYLELTRLEEEFSNLVNLQVTAIEENQKVVFLHKIIPGIADKSYGIHVAELAGMPPHIVRRAFELLDQFETVRP